MLHELRVLLEPANQQKFPDLPTFSGHRIKQNLRIGVEKNMLADRPHSNFADFLVALSCIKLKITWVPRIQNDALRGFVHRAPVMQRLQQLLAEMMPLKLRVNP